MMAAESERRRWRAGGRSVIIYLDPDDDVEAMRALALDAVLPSMTASTAEVRPAVIGATAA